MKYLQKSFTVAMSDKHPETARERAKREERALIRDRQLEHEYIDNGGMCIVCGLGREVERHYEL